MNTESRISFGGLITRDRLAREFQSVSATPPSAPDLSFRVVLPKTWTEVAGYDMAPLSVGAFSLVAAYQHSDDVSFQILATLIPHEINLVDWLEFQAHVQGFSLTDVQSGETRTGQIVHAVALARDGALLRLVTTGNASKVVLATGRMPSNLGGELTEALGLAAASFELTLPHRLRTREPLLKFTDERGMFETIYPRSWPPSPQNSLRPEKAGVTFRIEGETETKALLRVEADTRISLSDDGMEQLLTLLLDEVRESGVEVEDLRSVPPGELAGPRQRWLGTCKLPSGKGQIALLLRKTDTCWLAAVMLCPDKEASPMAWMRAKRAFEIAVATLRLPTEE